ncbi:hypothetical protein ACF1AL_14610 [Streptomyces sp. NPDC014801]|uniref:hypothetical protein n=1 Tax=Streptomyces sp. NPDC014801 TaxID=3364916 RepID=UPI0036F84A27
MTRRIADLDVPLPTLEQQIAAASFEQAAARTHSPSKQIAYRLDAWLITHPGACATDQDYPGWAEHIAQLQAANQTRTEATA